MKSNQRGFSLVELLVVVIIIAIVAAIAIPNLLASRRAANQAAAIGDLRTIHSAETAYFSTDGNNTGYALLADLATKHLLDASWASGVVKNTYTFTEAGVGSAGVYCVQADPDGADTISKHYAVSQDGTLYEAPNNGALTCPASVDATIGGGNPVGSAP